MREYFGEKWAAAGGTSESVCALVAPSTTEATEAAVHDGREPPHGSKLWYCGVVWCGFERFLFDGFYLRGVLYWRTFAILDHTTPQWES